MATTTTSATSEGEDRVLATAQRIVQSLRTSKDVTDDMLLILSSFDNRLSNISDLISGDDSGHNPLSGEIARLDAAEKVILRHDRPSDHLFDPDSGADEVCEYLAAVDEVLELIVNVKVIGCSDFMDRVESVVQTAMSKLEDELRRVLVRCAVPLDAERLYGSMRRVTLSFASHDGDLIDDEFASFSNKCFHERGGSIAGDVSVDLIRPDVVSDLREIADRMIRAGYEKECCQVYSSCRKDAIEECLGSLGVERVSIEEVQRIEWSDLDEKMKRWVQAVKIVVRVLLNGEKKLCEMIFDGSDLIKDVCFVETAKGCVMQLLHFGEAVGIGKRSPEKLFRILDMYEGLNGTLRFLQVLFLGESGEFVCSEAKGVLDSLGEAVRGTFAEFERAVKGESSKRPVSGGEIHPIARYVMNYVKLIVDYSDNLNSLLETDVNEAEGEDDRSSGGGGGGVGVGDDELREIPPLGRKLTSLINYLELNLEEKAKYYEDNGMQYIFLMNNKHYIVQKVKDNELGKLLGDNWVRRRRGSIRKYATSYLRASWTRVLGFLRDEGIGSGSSNASKTALKERFKSFNACFEEIYRVQTGWKVPDPQLRTELRISISEKLIPAYRSFLGRNGSQLESGRHAGKYIKFAAEDLDGYLGDLFEGTPGVIHHLRRKSS